MFWSCFKCSICTVFFAPALHCSDLWVVKRGRNAAVCRTWCARATSASWEEQTGAAQQAPFQVSQCKSRKTRQTAEEKTALAWSPGKKPTQSLQPQLMVLPLNAAFHVFSFQCSIACTPNLQNFTVFLLWPLQKTAIFLNKDRKWTADICLKFVLWTAT